MPSAEIQFSDENGAPYAGGKVYFYIPNTTTPKNTWQDAGATILNTNPITLDSAGRAIIYGTGQYRQILKDSIGNTIWDELTQDVYGLITSSNNTFTGTNNFTGTITAVTQAAGDSSNKVATDAFVANAILGISGAIAPGVVVPYPGSTTPPTGWLLCYGQLVSTATYATLFGIIGYAYGGSGANFAIPDLRGRGIAGLDNMGGSGATRLTTASMSPNANTLGASGGAETVTLDITMIPAHTHTIPNLDGVSGGGPNTNVVGSGTEDTGSTGGGLPHLNVQPTLLMNWIIYTGNGGAGGNSGVTSLNSLLGDLTITSSTLTITTPTSGSINIEGALSPLSGSANPNSSSISGSAGQFYTDTSDGNSLWQYLSGAWVRNTYADWTINNTPGWDPFNSTPQTLSVSNTVATAGGTGYNYGQLYATPGKAGGKRYWEIVPSVSNFACYGVSTRCILPSSQANQFGTNSNPFELSWAPAGTIFILATTVTNIQGWAGGDTLCFAADIPSGLIWFRTNGGNWNNSGSANPATGIGGINFRTGDDGASGTAFGIGPGPLFVGGNNGGSSGNTATINLGTSAFAQAVPSGFTSWKA